MSARQKQESAQSQPTAESSSSSSQDSIIDHDIFDQLLQMDDDDNREFTKGIVWNYFEQAETTFKEMEESIQAKDLPTLSSKGHFLKGSSAALGISKVKQACEQIQNYGAKKDDDGSPLTSEKEALDRIQASLSVAKLEFTRAESYLKNIFKKWDCCCLSLPLLLNILL